LNKEETTMSVGLLVLRVLVGALFAGHGLQKLLGWFGGHGIDGTAGFFDSLGLRPARAMAIGAGMAEFGGGLLFALGYVTPLAAALISAVMFCAIWTVHRVNGLWVTDGGYEYNLVLLAIAFAVTAIGPGKLSADNWVGISAHGVGWALLALAIGLVGTVGALLVGRIGSVRRGSGGTARTASA
jgi:putative oxidoreductase